MENSMDLGPTKVRLVTLPAFDDWDPETEGSRFTRRVEFVLLGEYDEDQPPAERAREALGSTLDEIEDLADIQIGVGGYGRGAEGVPCTTGVRPRPGHPQPSGSSPTATARGAKHPDPDVKHPE